MPVTTLDPRTALVVVDLQKGILTLPTAHPTDEVVLVTAEGGAPGRTQQSFGRREMPTDWAELAPELNRHPNDHTVVKRTWGAFTGTDLDAHLRGEGVTQVVVVGIATTAGVESTARHAHENGYNVTLAVDAMTDLDAEAHENSVRRIFPKMAETGTTAEIVALLP